MRIFQRSAVAVLFVAVSAVSAARGDSLLVGNLKDAPADSDTIDADVSRAQGFRTGGRAWNLNSVDAALGGFNAGGTFEATAALFASTTNSKGEDVPDPSKALAKFLFPTIGSGFSTLRFTATSNFVLQADTEYWFVLSVTSAKPSGFDWQYTNSTSLDPGSEGTLTSAAWTIPPGMTGAGGWVSEPNQPYLIAINGTPVVASVPEPSSWIMAGLGVSCVFTLVGRRGARIAG